MTKRTKKAEPAVVAEAVATPPKFRQADLGVESIRSDGNHREGEMDIASLAASIVRDGLLQPLIVCQSVTGDCAFQVLDGRRRLAAVKQLGWTRVSAVVLDCGDQDRQEALAAVANLERKDLTPVEEGLAVAQLLETLGAKRGDLERGAAPAEAVERAAALLGRSPAWVKERGILLRLSPEVRALVADGRLPLGQAKEIAKLVSAKDQKEVAGQTLGGYEGIPDAKPGEAVQVAGVRSVRRWVAKRLSTLRGVPWQPDVDFAGRPACATCPENSANCLLFGGEGDKAPDARCLNAACHSAKMKAAEKALEAAVKKAKADPKVQPTAAGVRGAAPEYLKPTTLARELARARGLLAPKKARAGAEEAPCVPWEKTPEGKLRAAENLYLREVEKRLVQAIEAKPLRILCLLIIRTTRTWQRHHTYGKPSKGVQAKIEPLLRRAVSATEKDVKALLADIPAANILPHAPWIQKRLADLLNVDLPPKPKLEDFEPKPKAEKPPAKGAESKPTSGVCRVCGCTEDSPCAEGCAWTDKTRTLCTACARKAKDKKKAKARKK